MKNESLTAAGSPRLAANDTTAPTCAEAIMSTLVEAGYRCLFCVPGGYAMVLQGAACRTPGLTVVQCHDERHAASMAEGCARNGVLAALLTITGPGLTGALTGITNAYQEGTPIFHIGAEVANHRRARGAAQHIDTLALVSSVVKSAQLLESGTPVGPTVLELAHCSRSGRPGPVYLGVPLDVATQPSCEAVGQALPAYTSSTASPEVEQVTELTKLLIEAQCPVVLAGYGVRMANAQRELRQLVDRMPRLRVMSSPRALCEFPRTDPRCLGVVGLAGDARLPDEADLLLVLGSRLWEHTATPIAKRLERGLPLAHVDIEASTLGAIYPVRLGICADIKELLTHTLAALPQAPTESTAGLVNSRLPAAGRAEEKAS